MRKCSVCEGHGCPACLGFGWDCRRFVEQWGQRFLSTKLTPEKVPDLSVENQRRVRAWCLEERAKVGA